ncbi:MAG: hypothetical protein IIB95_14290 [Candidatus Marinimicrobia bacterium]|nr:hypothetical protein [Candidatus Neomarinimicrobiota bacterium]
MNKLFTITTFLFLLGCASTVPLTEEEKIYQEIIEFDGNKADLYTKSLDWATTTFTGSHQLVYKKSVFDQGVTLQTGTIQQDKEAGLIISTGYVEIISFPVLQIKYMCRIDLKLEFNY